MTLKKFLAYLILLSFLFFTGYRIHVGRAIRSFIKKAKTEYVIALENEIEKIKNEIEEMKNDPNYVKEDVESAATAYIVVGFVPIPVAYSQNRENSYLEDRLIAVESELDKELKKIELPDKIRYTKNRLNFLIGFSLFLWLIFFGLAKK